MLIFSILFFICRNETFFFRMIDYHGMDVKCKHVGAYDDPNGSHISIEVTSDKFQGKRAVQRQQMVYKAIWEEMQGAVHAVDSMVCKAPDEE